MWRQRAGDPSSEELCDQCGQAGHTVPDCPGVPCRFYGQTGRHRFYCPSVQCHLCGRTGRHDRYCRNAQCLHCGQTGHISDVCPNAQCHLCGQTGHPAQNCPRVRCHFCGQVDHTTYNCSNVQCHRCGWWGHVAPNCPDFQCRSCGQAGHVAQDCPHALCQLYGQVGHTAQNCSTIFSNIPSSPATQGQGQQQGASHARKAMAVTTACPLSTASNLQPTSHQPSTSQGGQGSHQVLSQTAVQHGQQSALHQTQTPVSWRQCVREWYPDLLQRTHFRPHVYMHRVMRETVQVSGVKVRVPQTPQDQRPAGASNVLSTSDVRDDRAQQHVLHCLQALAKTQGDVMFVLSQLGFGDYLNDPCYAAAMATLPRPTDLRSQGLDKGDFDVLLVHRQYGLLVGEIKAVGANATDRGLSQQQRVNQVLDKLRKMLKCQKPGQKPPRKPKPGQLQKARAVLSHMTGDLQPSPRVRATLMLPYVSSSTLRQALHTDQLVRTALCQDLDIPPTADPVDYCLCSDNMSDASTPHGVSETHVTSLRSWWTQCVAGTGPDPAMTDSLYEELVARFAGPATVVKIFCKREPRLVVTDIRTAGQFISEVGDRISAVALLPYQLALIHTAPELAYLAGPPGTGKTLTAVIMGVEWMRRNKTVDILSGDRKSRAAAHHIKQQLEETARLVIGPQAASRVRLHLVHLAKKRAVDNLVKTLTSSATNNEICLIADEASGYSNGLDALYQALHPHCHVRLWAAALQPASAPTCLKYHVTEMSIPLRSPPCVVREVGMAAHIQRGDVPKYTAPAAPLPADGPPVLHVRHQGPGHEKRDTRDCETCGREVGRILTQVLHVGQGSASTTTTTTSSTSTATTTSAGQGGNPSSSTTALQYRDVFVLSWGDLHDDVRDDAGDVTRPANGVVRGLRQAGVPVRVVGEGDDGGVEDMATMTGPDCVTATRYDHVQGLERKVVVWVGDTTTRGVVYSNDAFYGRLYAVSRCTAQLIWVTDNPPSP